MGSTIRVMTPGADQSIRTADMGLWAGKARSRGDVDGSTIRVMTPGADLSI